MSSKTSWLVKGYPYSVHIKAPTPADNNYIAPHIWINSATETAYILLSVIDGVASWTVRAPDYIKNEGTEYQINVVERTATGTQSTGAGSLLDHVQGTDQGLDTGGSNYVAAADVKDAVLKKHSNSLDHALDHSNALDHAQGTDQGLDTGGPNAVTVADVKDAVDKKHSNSPDHAQGTDQGLDTGGPNAVVVADVKDAVDKKHSNSLDHSNALDHSNSLDHPQGTDQGLDTGGANAVTVAEVKDAVDKKHSNSLDHSNALDHAAGSDDQDLSGLVEKATGYSLVADTEIAKIHASGSDNQDLSGLVTKVATSPAPTGYLPEYDATGNLIKSDKTAAAVHSNALDHVQGTDQGLDTGGANAVTAADVRTAVDTLAMWTGLFDIDVNGDLEPVTDVQTDAYYELDVNDDIMPLAA